jgi:RNA polymerase sigma factor (sigma-70 family)
MQPAALGHLILHIRNIAGREIADSDAELLRRYAADGNESAFASLMQRHGGMVWRVCRNVLRHDQDAEDAFQATFAVLIRNAQAIHKGEALASWLHGVAIRIATRARRDATLRRIREQGCAKSTRAGPSSDVDLREALAIVDEEVGHLSEKYRTAFVLCILEGRSPADAARLLAIREGTLAVRLSRARSQLRQRLERRGVTLTAALSVAALAHGSATASPPARLRMAVESAARVAGKRPAAACSLTNTSIHPRVVPAMAAISLRSRIALMLALCVFGAGTFVARRQLIEAPALASTEAESDAKGGSADRETDPNTSAAQLGALRGTWTTTVTERRFVNGEAQPPQEVKVTFVIDDNKLFILGKDGFIDQEMTLKLDPAPQPKNIDLVSNQDGTLLGVYSLDGDTLRICLQGDGKRPAALPADDKLVWGVLHRVSLTPAKAVPRFATAPGWFWSIEPKSPYTSMSTLGIVFLSEKASDGATLVTLASAFGSSRDLVHRPVVLDASKNRYFPAANGGGSSARRDGPGVTLSRWRLDPRILPADKVAFIGVETLSPKSRPTAARAALDRAVNAGIEILPCPEIGKPFDFTLTTIDGKKLRSADLRGKVIVIDCWESGCVPCVEGFPALKDIYEMSHKDGLEIIGISFDRSPSKVRNASARNGLPWPQVMVRADEEARKLWEEATGIDAVPRLFLIDRQGILRSDQPKNLTGEVAKLLNDKSATIK